MNKMWKVFLIICFLCVSGCMKKDEKIVKSDQKEREITLHIQVIHEVESGELMNKDITVKGNIHTLEDFLQHADELAVETTKGQYGTTLMGMLGVRTEDFKKGPWWLYDSDNNTSCKEKGQCDAIDILQVNDQDQFTFHFTSSF